MVATAIGGAANHASKAKPSVAWEEDDDTRRVESPGPTNGIIPDVETIKEQLRQEMTRPQYNVADLYRKRGFPQWLVRHQRFEQATIFVILFNAVWIAVDTDYNKAKLLLQAPPLYQIMEHFFCTFFLYEWLMRFLAFESKAKGFKDSWFCFDTVLMVTMVIEAWIMTAAVLLFLKGGTTLMGDPQVLRVARLLRLSRMARMARLLRTMPELTILMKGLLASMRSVFFTLGLLITFIYAYAIAFTQLCMDTPCESFFVGVVGSMHTLLLNGALLVNLDQLITTLQDQSLILVCLLYTFILLAALTLMNMLVGVICEVVSAVAATEREAMTLSFLLEKIQELMNHGDTNKDGMISKAEFMRLLANPEGCRILTSVGVDVVVLVDLADVIFEGVPADPADSKPTEQRLGFKEFASLVLDLRGTNAASVRDVVALRRYVSARLSRFEQLFARIETQISQLGNSGIEGSPSGSSAVASTRGGVKRRQSCPSNAQLWVRNSSLNGTESRLSNPEPAVASRKRDNSPRSLVHQKVGCMTCGDNGSTLPLPLSEPVSTFRACIEDSLSHFLAAHEQEVSTMHSEIHELRQRLQTSQYSQPEQPQHSNLCNSDGDKCVSHLLCNKEPVSSAATAAPPPSTGAPVTTMLSKAAALQTETQLCGGNNICYDSFQAKAGTASDFDDCAFSTSALSSSELASALACGFQVQPPPVAPLADVPSASRNRSSCSKGAEVAVRWGGSASHASARATDKICARVI